MYIGGSIPGTVLMTADGSVPKSGTNEVRIFTMHVISGATAGQVKLYDGNNANGTLKIHVTCPVVSSGNTFDFGAAGIVFTNGCWYQEVVGNNVVSTAITCYAEGIGEPSTSSSSSSSSSRSSSSSSSSSSCRSSSSSSRSSSSSSSSSRSSSSSSCSSSSCSSSSSSSCRSSSSSSRSSSSSSANP